MTFFVLLYLACISISVAFSADLTIQPGAVGTDVVIATMTKIKNAAIFQDDFEFYRRLAYVESYDGTEELPSGTEKYGGIWHVTSKDITILQNMTFQVLKATEINSIRINFGIDVTTLAEQDLQQPLCSALVKILSVSFNGKDHLVNPVDTIAKQALFHSLFNSNSQADQSVFIYRTNLLTSGCRTKFVANAVSFSVGLVSNNDYTQKDCQRSCELSSTCVAYQLNFNILDLPFCWLQNSATALSTNLIPIDSLFDRVKDCPTGVCWAVNPNYYSYGERKSVSTDADCKSVCLLDTTCLSYRLMIKNDRSICYTSRQSASLTTKYLMEHIKNMDCNINVIPTTTTPKIGYSTRPIFIRTTMYQKTCPPQFTLWEDHCFAVIIEADGRDNSEAVCNGLHPDSHLLITEQITEYDIAQSFIDQHSTVDGILNYFINGYYEENNWIWKTQYSTFPIASLNWDSGQPWLVRSDAAIYMKKGGGGKWSSGYGDEMYQALCEYD